MIISPDDSELLSHVTDVEDHQADPYYVYQLANVCRKRGLEALARQATTLGLGMPHRTHRQLVCRGEAKLALEDWSGWVDRESRLFDPARNLWQHSYWRDIRSSKKAWDGSEDLRDKTLFVIGDGSDSDCLRMLRFIPALADTVRELIVGVSPRLLSLVKHNFDAIATITFRDIDHGIPFRLYTWLQSLPAFTDGLAPFAPLSAPRPRELGTANRRRLKVGLRCVSGGDNASSGKWDIPLASLYPLFERADIEWYSLQADIAGPTAPNCVDIVVPPGNFRSAADMANVMAGLDYLVTADSEVAHIAGCLEIPTAVLLHRDADPLWGLTDRTPWYPSLQLLRPPTSGAWAPMVKTLLLELANCRSATVQPSRGTSVNRLSQADRRGPWLR
jgi:hypothetical protein